MESNKYSQEDLKMALTSAIKSSVDKLEERVLEKGLLDKLDILIGDISINSQKFSVKVSIEPQINLTRSG